VQRLSVPTPVPGLTIMAVAAVGIVINTATALLFMRGRAHDLNLSGAFWHMAADALVSAGVVLAGGLTLFLGWTWLDPVVSLLIAAVIVWGTWGLFRRSLHLLFDGVPDGIDLAEVSATLSSQPGVAEVRDLHVWAMGTTEIALTAQLLRPGAGLDDGFLAETTALLRQRFGIGHVTLQVMQAASLPACGAPTGALKGAP